MNKINRWIPLESNCEIFNEYFHGIGLKDNFYFEELLSFDYKSVQQDPREFLENIIVNMEKIEKEDLIYNKDNFKENNIQFYMKQTNKLSNACGVVAALHSIGNINNNNLNFLNDNSLLKSFYSKKLNDFEYAEDLSNNNKWKEYHYKIAKKGKSIIPTNVEEVKSHYVCFIFNKDDNGIYELDGRLKGPYFHYSCQKSDFLDEVIKILSNRLKKKQIKENISILMLLEKKKEFI